MLEHLFVSLVDYKNAILMCWINFPQCDQIGAFETNRDLIYLFCQNIFLSFSRLEKAILVTLFSWYFHNRLAPLKVNSWINCAQRDQIGFFNVNKVLIYYIIPLKDLYCLFLTFLSELPDWLFWGQQLNKFGV